MKVWLVFVGLMFCTRSPGAEEELVVLPPVATLDGPNALQHLLAERVEIRDGQTIKVGEPDGTVKYEVTDSRVATVSADGLLTPAGDGVTTVRAVAGARSATMVVNVRNTTRKEPWSFRNQVLPMMTKVGCNSGACHGAAAGKGGFRLTLRGYGPEIDYQVMTRQAGGRRVRKTAPHESLVLLKPSGAVAHGGGKRFSTDSRQYKILSEWISAGQPAPRDDDTKVVRIQAMPDSVALRPGQEQRLLVTATYSDGRTADVTDWAKFESTDTTVATVDETGRLKVAGHGEAAISVWFSSLVDLARVTSKYENTIDPSLFANADRANRIDQLNLAKLEALGIPPSPTCDDSTFLRRAYLDATGTLPTVERVDAFIASSEPDKRMKLVDELLASDAFIDYWAYKWSDLLLVSSRNLPKPAMWSFYRFIRQSVAENLAWDEFARRILTAKGSTLDNGGGNYFVIHRDPIEVTENASIAFLGLSMTCARCHNHPMEKWTQDQYYGFANLFGRVKLKDGERGEGDVEVVPVTDGNVLHPRRGVAMPPEPLDGKTLALDEPSDRRVALADWLADPANPYFARALVNRVWANFFGRGLVDPEDDLRATNPPSDQALMDWLVDDFRAHKYDVRHLIRMIMTSSAYQRDSEPVTGNQGDSKFLSHYTVKRLPAEVMLDVIAAVTGIADSFDGYPTGWRSLQLPDSEVASSFLEAFGRPGRESTCSCERADEPSLSQALHLANGTTINGKLRDDNGAVSKLAGSDMDWNAIIDRLYKTALSRPPTTEELARLVPLLESSLTGNEKPEEKPAARRQAIEDLFWATLTGREFVFNH
jgi:Protein of unknown function (DUF1553)/Protein of unknown function (DUF1549)/Bacterial Ig-like domain (group 2)